MKIIEFFGLPQSGKSSIVEILIRSLNGKKDITNYRQVTIYHLFKKNKISYIEYVYWLYFEKKREKNLNRDFKLLKKKQKNIIKKFFKKLLPSKSVLSLKIDDLYNLNKGKHLRYIKFIEDLSHKYAAEEELKNIFDWIKFEISGYELKKEYPKKIMINSEGFYQICLSLIIRINLDKKEIEDYINLCPDIDQLYILINKDIVRENLEKYMISKSNSFNYNRDFIKKYFYTIKFLKKKLNTTVYLIRFSQLNNISNKISKELVR